MITLLKSSGGISVDTRLCSTTDTRGVHLTHPTPSTPRSDTSRRLGRINLVLGLTNPRSTPSQETVLRDRDLTRGGLSLGLPPAHGRPLGPRPGRLGPARRHVTPTSCTRGRSVRLLRRVPTGPTGPAPPTPTLPHPTRRPFERG